MKGNQTTILVESLRKDFGDFTAVNGVSFHVDAGEIFGFLGPNGSGKTTTIRMMLGLLSPTAGDVHVLDIPVIQDPGSLRAKVGYMSQQFSLYNDLTVEQNLRFYGTAYGLSNAELHDQMKVAVDLAGLGGREKVKTEALSGGWRQRLALSAAILHRPQVLFLDEPTAGVDPVSRREFWELLYKLVEDGVTVFVTTHYMDEAEHCHRLAFIQRGEIIATGSPQTLKETMMDGRVVQIYPSDSGHTMQLLRKASDSKELPLGGVALYGAFVHVILRDDTADIHELENYLHHAEVEFYSLQEIEPSLEDVFIACMD
ncbi:MAG: ABC transporter ATP-binding protein [Anaerolineales bacterium]|nr:MAG: ABC transporter ATP-binding protein [Anaerolineales bacterium]